MGKLMVVAFLLFVGLVAAVSAAPPTAHACSCPDCHVVRDSDVIVAGTVAGWTRASDASSGAEIPIDVRITVSTVWKGTAGSTITLRDPASLVNLSDLSRRDLPEKLMWMSGGGGCEAFTDDPSGKFVIVGFRSSGETANRIFGPAVFFIGDEPSGERYTAAVARLGAQASPRPPAAGNSEPATAAAGSDDWMFLSAIGAAMLLFTLVVALCVRRPR